MKRLLVTFLSLFSGLAAFSQATQVDAVKLVKNGPAGYYYRANAGGTANEWVSGPTVLAGLGAISGSGISGRIALWNGSATQTSNAAFTYLISGDDNRLTITGARNDVFGKSFLVNAQNATENFSITDNGAVYSKGGYFQGKAQGGYYGLQSNELNIFSRWMVYESPQLSVDVTGDKFRFLNYIPASGDYLTFNSVYGANNGVGGSAGGSYISNILSLKANGNVGIGTSSPPYKFSVLSDGGTGTGYTQGSFVSYSNSNTGASTQLYGVAGEIVAGLQGVKIAGGSNGIGVGRLKLFALDGAAQPFGIQISKFGVYIGSQDNTNAVEALQVVGSIRASGSLISDALVGTGNRLSWASAAGVLGFADASVTTSSTQVAIAAQGTRNMRIGAGGNTILATGTDRNLEVRDDGSIQLHGGLTADPSSPNVAAFWWNSTTTRAKYHKDGSTNRTIANLEDDILGLADAIVASTHTPGGTTRLVRYDGNANAVAVELGASLEEYQKYTFPCTRNATNAITFSAASGYSFRESGNPTLFTTSLTAAAHTTYLAVRVGTVIYLGKI